MRRDSLSPDAKIVSTRWVIVNKSSTPEPQIKARLVCQEFATYRDMDLFSGTPGLPAVKSVLSDLATNRGNRILMIVDVKGAFLYGKVQRPMYIELPSECGQPKDKVGRLKKA